MMRQEQRDAAAVLEVVEDILWNGDTGVRVEDFISLVSGMTQQEARCAAVIIDGLADSLRDEEE